MTKIREIGKTLKLISIHYNNMSHNKAIALMAIFALMIVVSISYSTSVFASPYNTTDNAIAFNEGSWCSVLPLYYTPMDPKIACDEANPEICVMAYYESNSWCTLGVKVFMSIDGFQTPNECTSYFGGPDGVHCFFVGQHAVNWNSWATTQNPYYHLPFDVVWSGKSGGNVTFGAFYIAVEDKVYRYLRGTDTTMCDACANDIPIYLKTFTCGGSFVCRETTDFWTCGWDNGDVEHMLVCGGGYHESYASPQNDKWIHSATAKWNMSVVGATYFYDYVRSGAGVTNTRCQYGLSNCPTTWYLNNMTYYSGPMESGYDFAYQARVGTHTYWGATGFIRGYTQDISNFTEPVGMDSSHHELGYDLYTMNVSAGILSNNIVGEYTSFGSSQPVYASDQSIYEVINWSDSDVAVSTSGSREYIAWYRSSNSTGDGIYVYNRFLNIIVVQYDPAISATANLYCADSNYTTSAVGYDGTLRLSTPCNNNENNTIVVFASNEPTVYVFNVSFDESTCGSSYLVNIIHEEVPFDVDFEIRSLFESGIVVSGATVAVSGASSGVTDSLGRVTISNVNPFINVGMRVVQDSPCSEVHSVSATVVPRTLTISKAGYKTYTDPDMVLASYVNRTDYNDWSYVTSNTTRIEVTGTLINVSLETAEGIYIQPCGYTVYMSGADLTRRGIGGTWTISSSSTRFPVLFRLEDTDPYWDETISILAPDGSWYNKTVNVTADETYDIPEGRVIIEKALNELSCKSECDCPETTCIGNYFYSSSGCSKGFCEYDDKFCDIACDTKIGCYQEDTTIPCTFDTDCPSACLTDYAMEYGLCGADGFCKNITQECATFCNTTVQFCDEMIDCRFGSTLNVKASVYYGGSQLNLLSDSYTCDLSNVGERTCIGAGTADNAIPRTQLTDLGLTIADVYITPSDWYYVTSSGGTWYNFSDISVYCNTSCGLEYTVCGGNCDQETGKCLSSLGGIENTIKALFPLWLQWMLTSLFLWSMLALIVGGVLTYIPSKISQNAQPTPQFGLAGMFVMYMIGIPFGFVDPVIGLIIVIGLGLYLAKMISSSMSGS